MLAWIRHVGRVLVRVLAFAAKEAGEVIRQPRLILSLLLGPTLILLLFGIGYQSSQPQLDTILVVPANPPEGYDVAGITNAISATVNVVQVTSDQDAALARLQRHEVDLVEIWPQNFNSITATGQRVPVEFVSNEINPFNEQWIQYLAYGQINEVNNMVLTRAAAENQGQLVEARTVLASARAQVSAMRTGVTTADDPGQLERVEVAVAALSASAALDPTVSEETKNDLRQLQEDLRVLREARDQGRLGEEKDRLEQTDARLARLESAADQLKAIPPETLVQPFIEKYQNLAKVKPDPMVYYAPAVLALLIQHICVTLGALSLVRERTYGSMELYRVAPISAFQMLTGKYYGYLVFVGVMVAILVALMVFGLRIPFYGDLGRFSLDALLLVLASLGVGLTISAMSSTDSQAVQLSMLMLLVSIFFGGFFLALESFRPAILAISYALPITHAIQAFQSEMLLGESIRPDATLWLAGIALVTFLTALFFTSRHFRRK